MHPASLLKTLLILFSLLTARLLAADTPTHDGLSPSVFVSALDAVGPSLTSYASAHSTDADYKSIKSYLATQTAIPKATIAFATGADYFPDQRLVPEDLISALPTTLRSYVSAYASGFDAAGDSAARGSDGVSTSLATAAPSEVPTAGKASWSLVAGSSTGSLSGRGAGSVAAATGNQASATSAASSTSTAIPSRRIAATTSEVPVAATGLAVKGLRVEGFTLFAGVVAAYAGVLAAS